MDLNEIVGGLKIVSEVIAAEHPDVEKIKTVAKAVALGYCKLLPKINPKLREMPIDERFIHCGTAAFATVAFVRNAYRTMTDKITVEEGARNIANMTRVAIASIPKAMAILGHTHPVFKTVAIVMAPVCQVLAPRVADKVYYHAKKNLTTAKSICRSVVAGAKKIGNWIKSKITG